MHISNAQFLNLLYRRYILFLKLLFQNRKMKSLLFDPSISGVSGDMILAVLADEKKLRELENLLSEFKVKLSFERIEKGHTLCSRLKIKIGNEKHFRNFDELRAATKKILAKRKKEKEFVFKVFKIIENAELAVHGEIHGLHELGSVDTLIDVIGAAISLPKGKKIYSLPIAVGSAAPAVLEIAKQNKVPLFFKKNPHELATPTGAAILAASASFVRKTFMPLSIKYSTGTFPIPGYLRLMEVDDNAKK